MNLDCTIIYSCLFMQMALVISVQVPLLSSDFTFLMAKQDLYKDSKAVISCNSRKIHRTLTREEKRKASESHITVIDHFGSHSYDYINRWFPCGALKHIRPLISDYKKAVKNITRNRNNQLRIIAYYNFFYFIGLLLIYE